MLQFLGAMLFVAVGIVVGSLCTFFIGYGTHLQLVYWATQAGWLADLPLEQEGNGGDPWMVLIFLVLGGMLGAAYGGVVGLFVYLMRSHLIKPSRYRHRWRWRLGLGIPLSLLLLGIALGIGLTCWGYGRYF